MKIAINGSLGSGKSTVAKALAQKLGYQYISTGAWFRAMAEERGVTLSEMSAIAEKDPTIDDTIDARLKALNGSPDNLIIDSRMAAFFIEDAFRVRLTVSEEEGAKRIWKDNRGPAERFDNLPDAIEAYRVRSASERKRYKEAYDVNVDTDGVYDLALDTTHTPADAVASAIEQAVCQRRDG